MVILIIGVNKMYKRLKKIFLVMSILGVLFTNTYAEEVKEVQLIDDFSAELLGEPKDQEPAVQKSPVKQDTQEVTENKNPSDEHEKKQEDKITENKDENKLRVVKLIKDNTQYGSYHHRQHKGVTLADAIAHRCSEYHSNNVGSLPHR